MNRLGTPPAGAPFDPTGGLGVGKGWREPFEVIAGLIGHRTDEEFARLEPKFNRAFKRFKWWVGRLKQNPGRHDRRYFRDAEFTEVIRQMYGAVSASRLMQSDRGREIGAELIGLILKSGYIPR